MPEGEWIDLETALRELEEPICSFAEFRLDAESLTGSVLTLFRKDATSPVFLQLRESDEEECRKVRGLLPGVEFVGPTRSVGFSWVWVSRQPLDARRLRHALTHLGQSLSLPLDRWVVSGPGETWSLQRIIAWMSLLVLVGAAGSFLALALLQNAVVRMLVLAPFFLVGAFGLGVILLNCLETLSVLGWRRWACSQCGERYEVRQYSDAKHWGIRSRTVSGGGVILRCWHCGREQSFDGGGRPVDLTTILDRHEPSGRRD